MRAHIFCGQIMLLSAILAVGAMPATAADRALPTLRPIAPLTADDLAQLLGAYVWKVGVEPPAGATHFDISLSLKEKGHDAQGFGAGIAGPIDQETKGELLIAVIPIGAALTEAENVKVVISGFGILAESTRSNPFRKMKGIGRPGAPEDNKDGAFSLIGGFTGSTVSSPVSSADTALSLKIEMKK